MGTQSMDLKEWSMANDRIVGALCSIVDDTLLQELEKLTTAKAAWQYLKQKTHQASIISKLTALQNAICTRFTTATSILPTIADIKDLMANIYNEDAPTQEEWTLVILLQALADGEYEWLCKQFVTMLMNKDTKLLSHDNIKQLEAEAQEAHANESRSMQEATLAARFKKVGCPE